MAKSYVRAATIKRIEEKLMPRVFETQKSLNNGGVRLVLGRFDPATGEYVALPPQTAIFKNANRQESGINSESATTTTIGGDITFLAPFDVQPEDVFTLEGPDGYVAGRILVVFPRKLGRQRATWTLRAGGI